MVLKWRLFIDFWVNKKAEDFSDNEETYGLIYIHAYSQHIVTPRPAMYGRYDINLPSGCGISIQLMPHLVGQLLLPFVQVCRS